MANQLGGRINIIDTDATTLSGQKYIRLVQWIDNAADIADDDGLVLVMNGVTVTGKIALTANELGNLVVYQLGPFNPGIIVEDFTVTTIAHGELLVVLD